MLLLEVPLTLGSESIRVIGFKLESFSVGRGELLLNCWTAPVLGLTAESGAGSAELSRSGGNLKFGWITPGDFFAVVALPEVVILFAAGLLARFGADVSSFDSVIMGGETPSPRGDGCPLEFADAPPGIRVRSAYDCAHVGAYLYMDCYFPAAEPAYSMLDYGLIPVSTPRHVPLCHAPHHQLWYLYPSK
jgi:hypothetical protein